MTRKKIRLLFLLPSLAGGGAERCALNILKLLPRDTYSAYLGVIKVAGPFLGEVPADVKLVEFSPQVGRLVRKLPIPAGKGFLVTAMQLREVINYIKPEIVLSFMPEMSLPTFLVRCFNASHPFTWIVSEQNATRIKLEQVIESKVKRLILSQGIKRAYSAADHIKTISEGLKRDLVEHFQIPSKNIVSIYNPVDVSQVQQRAHEPISFAWPKEKVILGVGKLTKQKGFDILIQAFAKIRPQVAAKLVILGRGEEKEQLIALAHQLGVADQVVFPGFVDNPWACMARADVFVLSSRWEGFANVIVEAMASGTAVIATKCDHGPGEIITQGKNGLLVPVGDVETLAGTISKVLEDQGLTASLREAGQRRALDFDVQQICSRYEDLFQRVMTNAIN